MREDIDVSAIRPGDRVKVSLYGLPESDWLEVSAAFSNCAEVIMPDGRDRLLTPSEITAHEPAAPALPDWWGAKVIVGPPEGHGVFIGGGYVFPNDSTHIYGPDDCEGWAVQVIVDRDGNQPAVDKMRDIRDWVIRDREEVAAERDDWRFRFEAFRAEVAKIRDFLSIRADEHLRHDDQAFDRGAAYVGHDAVARLTAILDGDDR